METWRFKFEPSEEYGNYLNPTLAKQISFILQFSFHFFFEIHIVTNLK